LASFFPRGPSSKSVRYQTARNKAGRYARSDLVKGGKRITDEAWSSMGEIVEFARLTVDLNLLYHDKGTFYIPDPALYKVFLEVYISSDII
jgi:hypothetical protein